MNMPTRKSDRFLPALVSSIIFLTDLLSSASSERNSCWLSASSSAATAGATWKAVIPPTATTGTARKAARIGALSQLRMVMPNDPSLSRRNQGTAPDVNQAQDAHRGQRDQQDRHGLPAEILGPGTHHRRAD